MNSSIVSKMINAELTHPYFDMDALRSAGTLAERYNRSVHEKKYASQRSDSDPIPEMIFAQYQAAKEIANFFEQTGISNNVAAEKSGIDKTSISKYLMGKRPFSPSAVYLAPFCYNVLNQSCHRTMFGEEGEILLPTIYSEAAKAFINIAPEEKERLLRKAKIAYTLYLKQGSQSNTSTINNYPRRDFSEMVGERIFDITADKGNYGYQLFGPDTPYKIRNFMRQFYVDDAKRNNPRLSNLMFISFETGMALDYFAAENFAKFVPCYYKDENQNKILITDESTLQFIGICSSVTSDQRSKMLGEAIGIYLSQVNK